MDPLFFKGLTIRITTIIPIKGRGFMKHGSTISLPEHEHGSSSVGYGFKINT